jgi:hypothetical protein
MKRITPKASGGNPKPSTIIVLNVTVNSGKITISKKNKIPKYNTENGLKTKLLELPDIKSSALKDEAT